MGVSQNGGSLKWMVFMENPSAMDDLGVILGNHHMISYIYICIYIYIHIVVTNVECWMGVVRFQDPPHACSNPGKMDGSLRIRKVNPFQWEGGTDPACPFQTYSLELVGGLEHQFLFSHMLGC